MSPETTKKTKICPTCGTRVSENAARCLVCGSDLSSTSLPNPGKPVQGTRMPEITLSLPAALGLVTILIMIGALIVYVILNKTEQPTVDLANTPTVTITITPTLTLTPTITYTPTTAPTLTPLPPISYTVKDLDTCSGIAGFFNVSINSIIFANNLSTSCSLSPGQVLIIPQPTPTASPQPTATLNSDEATEAACTKIVYTVKASDTLSSIALNYNVSEESIRTFNGLTGDTVYENQNIKIPLCQRIPTAGPTATATQPPPYPAPNLLLPADGAAFTITNDEITLHWASVGTLRDNEKYKVVIEDITEGTGKKLIVYVTDTKYTLPASFRPTETSPHIMRWYVTTVRQTGSDSDENAIYISAGPASFSRVFSWSGSAESTNPTATDTPAPTLTPTP
jgi:LysM repeat protein